MRILHLAAFNGNIGDNASHIGLRKVLSEIIQESYTIDNLEIRKFYNNYNLPDKHSFDAAFAELVNQYDLFIIGGGGFLDFWVENSVTGTTLNISNEILDLIKTPIAIISVGSIPHKEVPEGNIEKFRNFLDKLLNKKNVFIAVRNDGSKDILNDLIGSDYANAIPEVLDSGFFYENNGDLYKPSQKEYILINTTSDQVLMNNREMGKIETSLYTKEMSKVVNHILKNTDKDIVFSPHIYSDYNAINQLLINVNDYDIRTRIGITPFSQGDYGCNQIFSAYKNSSLVLGMRFHANVCSIAMNKQCIGIAALDRITNMYKSLHLSERIVHVDREFSDELIQKIHHTIDNHLASDIDNLTLKKEQTISLYKGILGSLL